MMKNVEYQIQNGTLVVCFSDRIDSTNASIIDSEAEKIRLGNPHEKMAIDVEKLEYISSAGLRVVLRLLKVEPGLKIINASSEVYDLFEMTGFTEMMKVEKALRRISLVKAEPIAKGANGEVYRTAPDTIVKVYLNATSISDIEREIKMARRAFILGIPTAIPFDIVKVGDKYGSVFELLNADSFFKCIEREPDKLDYYIQLSVDLMKKIHAAEVSPEEMPSQKQNVLSWATSLKGHLSDAKYGKLTKMIENIPESNHLLHCDLHFKNIMIQNGDVLLIDMDTLCHGDKIFEFASIYDAYVGFGIFDHQNIMDFFGIAFEEGENIWKKTIEYYFKGKDDEFRDDLEKKIGIISSLRIFCHLLKTGKDKEEKYMKQEKGYLEKLDRLLDEVDDLTIE